LVLREDIPDDEEDPLAWCACNNPLASLLPTERSEKAAEERLKMLRTQAAAYSYGNGPRGDSVAATQSYYLFVSEKEKSTKSVGFYSDILDQDGKPVTAFRMASVSTIQVPLCRLVLHSLFWLNEARLAGGDFSIVHQLGRFSASNLVAGKSNPRWAQFHPMRTLRTRRQLRNAPTPVMMRDGILNREDYERINDLIRRETCAHLLAFEREQRPREMALHQNTTNVCMTAYIHRANGGAIYVLPERLVEEFDHTDCGEVQLGDVKLPFSNLFLRFDPPHPLQLSENSFVDGCYIVRQGDEILLTLTSRNAGIDLEESVPVAWLEPTFSLHLPAEDATMSVNDAVEAGIEEFLSTNAPPQENMTTTVTRPDGTQTTVVDVRAASRLRRISTFRANEEVFRKCMNIVINAACFIAFRPDDITEGWEGEPPEAWIAAAKDPGQSRSRQDRKRDAIKRIDAGDFTRIRICGNSLFAATDSEGPTGTGTSPRAHWRRGHWRRQRHGVGLVSISLRWIRPTLVRREAGPVVEARLYDLGGVQSDHSPNAGEN
jgi:hypothetical protein